ncbi:hypothetical protein P7K49_002407 [Saguinus oedipus]|uniref:Uncharacterized protein n=1 Tax=Saguinus oedipus TaxID=9490 RepID=A0ABQ9WHA4_SAGOE|nr:hypothetical protein P7K49_002407 [Saguinus oedipus]
MELESETLGKAVVSHEHVNMWEAHSGSGVPLENIDPDAAPPDCPLQPVSSGRVSQAKNLGNALTVKRATDNLLAEDQRKWTIIDAELKRWIPLH